MTMRRISSTGFLVSLSILYAAELAQADHDLDTYAFNGFFVYDTFGGPSPVRRHFNVVVLRDTAELKIARRFDTIVDGNISSYAHHGTYLIVLIGDWVEVFDLKGQEERPLRRWRIERSDIDVTGTKGIRPDADGLTIVPSLNGRVPAKLWTQGDVGDWKLVRLDRDPKLSADEIITSGLPYYGGKDTVLVHESERHRFQVEWEKGRCSPRVNHRKFLRKRRTDDRQIVSSLLLGVNRKDCGH